MPDLEYLIPIRNLKRIIKVTITNPTSYATGNPHVQQIVIPHTALEGLLGFGLPFYSVPYFTYFFDPNQNTRLYSYYDSFWNNRHIFFVKTPQISANSSYTIYMIVDTTQNYLDGNYVGVNAYYGLLNLGIPYGQYDNGANVFYYYWNFAGTSLPSGWTLYSNGNTYSVNNGLTIISPSSASGNSGMVYNLSNVPSIGIQAREWYDILQCCGCTNGNDNGISLGNSFTGDIYSGNGYAFSIYGCGGGCMLITSVSNSSATWLTSNSITCGSGSGILRNAIWTYTNKSYLYHYESRVNILQTASSTTWTTSALSQVEIGTHIPTSNTTSYLIHTLALLDAPLSYTVQYGQEIVTPSVTFSPL